MNARRGNTGRFLLLLLVTGTVGACAEKDSSRTEVEVPPPPPDEVLEVLIENPNYTTKPSFFGYISATTLSVRESPGTAANAVDYVFKGDRVDIFESRDVDGSTWHRITDAAGYVDGWVSARFVSGRPVVPRPPPPSDYGEPRTPTVVTSVSARYVGTGACSRCHSKPAPGGFAGGAYGVWANHYHASAYKTLLRPYTRALAQQKRGVQDPATDWRCVKCHVSAFGVGEARLGRGYRNEDGVTCEVCHGPGGDYLLSHWEGQDGFESREAAGFRIYRNIEERDLLCRSCHNPLSPTYKPFNVAAFSEAIRHWSDEYVFSEDVSDTEVATEAPRPIEDAPDPTAETVVSPPPVTNIVETTTTTPTVEAAQPEPEVVTPPVPPVPAPQPEPVAAGRDEGPEDMVLDAEGRRGRVPFPHHEHFELVVASPGGETCQVCHHTNDAGATPDPCSDCHLVEATVDAPSAEKAYHGTCKNCHREEQAGPRKCSECHIR